jgi:hypothetical protein
MVEIRPNAPMPTRVVAMKRALPASRALEGVFVEMERAFKREGVFVSHSSVVVVVVEEEDLG